VPVGATRLMQMMRNACSQTPRAEGAAEVQIKLWLKVDSAQAPDLQFDRCLKHEYERVRARRCLQRIIHETLRNRDGITGSMIGKGSCCDKPQSWIENQYCKTTETLF